MAAKMMELADKPPRRRLALLACWTAWELCIEQFKASKSEPARRLILAEWDHSLGREEGEVLNEVLTALKTTFDRRFLTAKFWDLVEHSKRGETMSEICYILYKHGNREDLDRFKKRLAAMPFDDPRRPIVSRAVAFLGFRLRGHNPEEMAAVPNFHYVPPSPLKPKPMRHDDRPGAGPRLAEEAAAAGWLRAAVGRPHGYGTGEPAAFRRVGGCRQSPRRASAQNRKPEHGGSGPRSAFHGRRPARLPIGGRGPRPLHRPRHLERPPGHGVAHPSVRAGLQRAISRLYADRQRRNHRTAFAPRVRRGPGLRLVHPRERQERRRAFRGFSGRAVRGGLFVNAKSPVRSVTLEELQRIFLAGPADLFLPPGPRYRGPPLRLTDLPGAQKRGPAIRSWREVANSWHAPRTSSSSAPRGSAWPRTCSSTR